jgi:hypothetical protein
MEPDAAQKGLGSLCAAASHAGTTTLVGRRDRSVEASAVHLGFVDAGPAAQPCGSDGIQFREEGAGLDEAIA